MSTAILPKHFTTRSATLGDLEPIVALFNTCFIEQIGKPLYKLEDIQTWWQTPSFNMETDTRIVLAPDGKLVGCVGLWDSSPHVRVFADACVHPEYRGRSIGVYLSQWTEGRARQAIAQAPEGARVVSRCSTHSTNTTAQALLRQHGYQIVRHFFNMVIELDAPPPEPVVPEAIIIRPFVRERETHALVAACRESFKDHWGFVETPYEEELAEWETWMDGPTFDESLWFVAISTAS